MNARTNLFCRAICFAVLLFVSPIWAAEESEKVLLDVSAEDAVKSLTLPTKGQVTITRSQDVPGVVIAIAAGPADYPGISLKPKGAAVWDLSAFDHVEISVTNTGANAFPVCMKVENAGNWQDAPWNTEEMTIDPGKTQTLSVYFGFSFERKPGFKLKPEAVSGVRIFTKKTADARSLRIESIKAAGVVAKPTTAPASDAAK